MCWSGPTEYLLGILLKIDDIKKGIDMSSEDATGDEINIK